MDDYVQRKIYTPEVSPKQDGPFNSCNSWQVTGITRIITALDKGKLWKAYNCNLRKDSTMHQNA